MPGREISAHGSLAEVALRVPKGIICLLSALRFHGLTTQAPFEVWLAIENKAIAPMLEYPPLRIVRFSGAALTEGAEEHIVDGVTIRITGVAKTVAKCFKYRNKIGLDVALEALRDAWHEHSKHRGIDSGSSVQQGSGRNAGLQTVADPLRIGTPALPSECLRTARPISA
ncbi:Protein co-occurring with FIG00645039: hypothetical protein with HTH-domain [Methylomonas fluvii]|nr:Protein co-occurring with FIG00645039: hypothetical protein with HTH-domain [Methylomonas fluvii]